MTPARFSGPLTAIAAAIFAGSKTFPLLAQPISTSLASWISSPLNVQIFGSTSGLTGVGTTNGAITAVTAVTVMLPALQAAGLTGTTSASLASILEQGIRSALTGAQYQGTSAAVGSGGDTIVKIKANSAALVALLQSNLTAANLAGSLAPQFALGIATGTVALVQSCLGIGTVSGTASNIPATGTSLSRFL